MRRSTFLALASIFFLSLYLRLFPLMNTIYWGADYGEYYSISKGILVNGHVSSQYLGWGTVYPEFPGMQLLSAGFSLLSGVDVTFSISLIAPALASLSAIFVFFLAVEIFKDERMGLVAAGFVAVVLPHVYPTSHPMPGSIGDLLFTVCLLLFVKMQSNDRFLMPLIVSTLALVMTHHLSTYFLLICIAAGIFVKILYTRNPDLGEFRLSFTYLAVLAVIATMYWNLSTNFREDIMGSLETLPWWITIAILPLILFFLVFFALLRPRLKYMPMMKYPSFRKSAASLILILTAVFVIMTFLFIFGIPGTTMKIHPASYIVYVPLMLLISLAGFGKDYWQFYREGSHPTGWLIAILCSLLLGSFIASQVIIPYRHMEYLAIPLGIFVGFGLVLFLDFWLNGTKVEGKEYVPKNSGNRRSGLKRTAAMVLVLFLVLGNALSAYPSRDLMLGYDERTGAKSVDGITWIKLETSEDSTIASDHRLSSMTFGLSGRNSTWGWAPRTLRAESFQEAEDEMLVIRTPSGTKRIEYVFLDENVKTGAILSVWDIAEPLSQRALDKFEGSNYTKLFDNGFAQLYMVNW